MDREGIEMVISKASIKAIRKRFAFWIWATFAGGKVPFYRSQKLKRFRTFTEPKGMFRRWIWNRAVKYLISIGELTHTPTLKEKF